MAVQSSCHILFNIHIFTAMPNLLLSDDHCFVLKPPSKSRITETPKHNELSEHKLLSVAFWVFNARLERGLDKR